MLQESRLKELSAGLFDEEDSDVDVGDLDKLSVNPPVRRDDKKDEKQRRNEKQRKEEVFNSTDPCEIRMNDNHTQFLTLLHSERPKLYRVLAVPSTIGLKHDKL